MSERERRRWRRWWRQFLGPSLQQITRSWPLHILRVHKISKTKRTYDKIVPKKKQVYLMANAATSLRDKIIILTVWQSGLRNSTLRNFTIGHVKDGLLKTEIPLKVNIAIDIDKKNLREPYFTILGVDAIEAIRRYLRARGHISDIPHCEPSFLSNLKLDEKKTQWPMWLYDVQSRTQLETQA